MPFCTRIRVFKKYDHHSLKVNKCSKMCEFRSRHTLHDTIGLSLSNELYIYSFQIASAKKSISCNFVYNN